MIAMVKKRKNILKGLSTWQKYEHYEGKSKRLPVATPKAPEQVEITRKKRGPTNLPWRRKR